MKSGRLELLVHSPWHVVSKLLPIMSNNPACLEPPAAVSVSHSPLATIQATFHRGNDKFGETKSIQCSCITLFGIIFSALKNIARWTSYDLEYIIEQGDALHETTESTDYLSSTELPREITIENLRVNVDFIDNANSFGFLHFGSNCLSEIVSNISENHNHLGILVFCEGYCFSIISSARFVFVVDSHSRNISGQPTADGMAVILKFDNLVSVAAFIKHVFMDIPNKNMVQYEVQYVKTTDDISRSMRENVQKSHQSDRQKQIRRKAISSRVNKHNHTTCQKTANPVSLQYLPLTTIKATFHQSNDKFGETKGIQCSCITLFGVTFSAFRNIAWWTSRDLEYIIEQGDALYKTTGSTDYLSSTEFPREITIENLRVNVDFIDNANSFGFLHFGSNCLSEIVSNISENHNHLSILVFYEGYCFSIISTSRFVYVVDSHSQNELGEPSADGTYGCDFKI